MKPKNLEVGSLIASGKTKQIYLDPANSHYVYVVSQDDITAGDGAKRDTLQGKAVLANTTTCNVFQCLVHEGVPTAFMKKTGENHFYARNCTMLPLEVVVRREARGSYLKRHPDCEEGYRFEQLPVEFFLKTNDRRWGEHELPCDDPLMQIDYGNKQVRLFKPSDPDLPDSPAKPFLVLPIEDVEGTSYEFVGRMKEYARKTFTVLETVWQKLGYRLVDFKIEFGVTALGHLVVADVIDNDSWRLLTRDGESLDKDVYRKGGDLDDVLAKYRFVAELTKRFVEFR